MPVLKALDVAYARFSAPDLQRMEDFLTDFGMVRSAKTDTRLYMRGYGPSPYLHVTEEGPAGFVAVGLLAPDEDALHRIAKREGAVVEALDAPGGGSVVRLQDPDGFSVEVVFGQAAAAPLPLPSAALRNEAGATGRPAQPRRLPPGPSHVMRLGHVVLGVSDFLRSQAWYKERFGLLTSDEIRSDDGAPIAAFLRCDQGDALVDHHSLVLAETPKGRVFMHTAFEVFDFDDLMVGHAHLGERTRQHYKGIGRHYLGSQIFDYWRDPWGHEIEHWTDGDQFNAATPIGVGSMADVERVQWGSGDPH